MAAKTIGIDTRRNEEIASLSPYVLGQVSRISQNTVVDGGVGVYC